MSKLRNRAAIGAARLGIAAIAVAMVAGAVVTLPGYSSVSHTTSELAGQHMPHAWIMRTGFATYGAGTALAAALTFAKARIERTALILFGLGFIGTAIWSHVHIDPAMPADLAEDWWHSFFASEIGVAFALACTARLFLPGGSVRDLLAWTGLVASVALPLAMFAWPGIDGALQRLMFAISFAYVWARLGRTS